MLTQTLKGAFIPRHDTAINWSKAINFTPKNGELIVISADDITDVARGYYLDSNGNKLITTTVNNNGEDTICTVPEPSSKVRFKFGNGVDNVNVLPFVETGSSSNDTSLVFDTYDQLDSWLNGTDMCPDLDVFYCPPNSYITLNPNGDGTYYIDYQIVSGAAPLANVTLPAGKYYILSNCNDAFLMDSASFACYYSSESPIEISEEASLSVTVGSPYESDTSNSVANTLDDFYFKIISDSHKEDLSVGDILVVASPTYTEYIWDGSKAIVVELPESGVGRETDEGGEIFNDYENNQARTPMSSARGKGTVAGGKGFKIKHILAKRDDSNTLNILPTPGISLEPYNFDSIIKYETLNRQSHNITPNADGTFNLEYLYYEYGFDCICSITLNSGTYTFKTNNEDVYLSGLSVSDKGVFIIDADNTKVYVMKHFRVANEKTNNIYVQISEGEYDNTQIDYTPYYTPYGYAFDSTEDISSIRDNDIYSVRINSNYDNIGKIESVNTADNVVYADVSTFGTTTTLTNAYLWLPVMPEDWYTYDDPETKTSLKAIRKRNAGTTYMDRAQYAEGRETYAIKYAAHAEGNRSVAAGRWSHAEGNETYAAWSAHSEGSGTKAIGQCSHSEGEKTKAKGLASHSEGGYTTANGGYSHTEGCQTQANADFAHAEGQESIASEKCAHAEGYKTTASGVNSHSEGNQTIASGVRAHAEGVQTQATGANAHSEGSNTQATGDNSHARGYYSRAVGMNSVASGQNSVAEGDNSIASGYYCNTSKDAKCSLAHGDHAQVGIVTDQEAKWGVALGEYVVTDANHQIAIGRYNKVSDRSSGLRPIFMVGYGSSDTDRKNNFTVFRNGVARVGADPINDMDVTTKRYVDNKMRFMTQTEFDKINTSTLTAGTVVFITE